MRRLSQLALPVLVLALAAACSTTKIGSEGDPDFDYSKWKTYGWLPARGDVGEGSPFWPDLKRMVDRALAAKGLTPVAEGAVPDFMVSFFTGVGVTSDVDWGYLYSSPWMMANPRYLNNDDFAKGVIMLAFVDPKHEAARLARACEPGVQRAGDEQAGRDGPPRSRLAAKNPEWLSPGRCRPLGVDCVTCLIFVAYIARFSLFY